MADITMCPGVDCKNKETCYRYKAAVNPYYQSYSNFQDTKKGDICEHYYKIEEVKKTAKVSKR